MAKLSEEALVHVRKVESIINRNLFLICTFITIIVMAMATIEFFSRGAFFPSRIGFFYVGILFIYSAHKEMLRWLEEKGVERQGEVFLYSWIGLATLFYIINFLSKDYYSLGLDGKPLGCMSEVAIITLEVAAIFVLARLSKVIKIMLMKRRQD
jgi:hypothetical protein